MKKLLLITIIIFGLHGYAQKRLEIYNFTSYTVNIHELTTSTSGAYPMFSAVLPGSGLISVAMGASYILENPVNLTRFPFESPTSSPYIANWIRRTSPTAGTTMTSPVAWILGNAQEFDKMVFRIIVPSGNGSGTVGILNPVIIEPLWTVTYNATTVGTVTTYTVVFTP